MRLVFPKLLGMGLQKLGQKERNHQIEDEYRLAKVRKVRSY